ncbi:hypothetical protein PMAYCL1PPCAC_15772, partial [Pristionchus mayeri]
AVAVSSIETRTTIVTFVSWVSGRSGLSLVSLCTSWSWFTRLSGRSILSGRSRCSGRMKRTVLSLGSWSSDGFSAVHS